MQQLCRRTSRNPKLLNLVHSALLSPGSATSSVDSTSNSVDLFGLHIFRQFVPRKVSYQTCALPQERYFSLACRHGNTRKIGCAPFATKAEEYDLIVAEAGLVRIEGYDGTGFIVNDVQVQGAVFCLADLFMMWNLKSWQELTPDALSMLHLFKPAPDLVIIGCGLHSQMVPPDLQAYFKKHNIAYEAIDTANAVSTFNILNQEGRKVAGVLLPAASS